MFRAIARFFQSLGHFLTGRVDNARRGLDTDPHAMRSQYDTIIREKTQRIHQYKQAVAGLIAQQENKLSKIKTLGEETKRLEDLKAGALAKAQSVVAKLQEGGASTEDIHADEHYQKCLSAYNDFSSTLTEKTARIDELEGDVQEYARRLKEHKVQLQDLVREIDKLKAERSEAVAEVITAQQEKELADALSGIGEAGSADEKLANLRNLRNEVRAEARISKEMAGNDTKLQEAEFLEYARRSGSASEFDKLIGLAGSADKPASEAAESNSASKEGPSALPE